VLCLIERDTGATVREERLFRTARFAFRDLAAGHYRLSIDAVGAHRLVDVDLAAGAAEALNVTLPPVVTIVGRAVDVRTRDPAPGIAMGAMLVGLTFRNSTHLDDMLGISDDSGRFTLRDVLACLSRRDPVVGSDVLPNDIIRTCDNAYRFPTSGVDEVHALGQAWAGFVWHAHDHRVEQRACFGELAIRGEDRRLAADEVGLMSSGAVIRAVAISAAGTSVNASF